MSAGTRPWLWLALLAGACALLLVALEAGLGPRAGENARAEALRPLLAVAGAPGARLEPGPLLAAPAELGLDAPRPVLRVYRQERLDGVILPVATRGWGGTLTLAVGIDRAGGVTGARVISHRETPGLGDAIAGPWLAAAAGGAVDGITGATRSSDAALGALALARDYFARHRQQLLAESP